MSVREELLDCLYDTVEDLLMSGDTEVVDNWMSSLLPSGLSDAVIIGMLTITLPYRDFLPHREGLVSRVRPVLDARHGTTRRAALLMGLE